MNAAVLVLLAIVLLAVSGLPGLFLRSGGQAGQGLANGFVCLGAGLGAAAAVGAGISGSATVRAPWSMPGGEFAVLVDGLAVLFLLPVFLIGVLGSIYGLRYWRQADRPQNGQKLRFFYGLVLAGMALLVIAHNSIVFLLGWEVMALSAFFLVITEDQDAEVRAAGWLYLAATHFATLALFGLFGLLRFVHGSFELKALEGTVSSEMATAILLLALFGFGIKAGVMPLHVWLPSAHAMAPSHVSALMSGVLIKMGIYGLVRVVSFFPHPPVWWASLVLALGAISGILGVVFAIGQHDIKRLLAYHSIENIGIIVMGLGLALFGRSLGRPEWVVLGLSGTLLHVWNHGLFKALLFFSAGSVIHATHTREIDHLGGLAKVMPHTALAFLIGAVAICGLPPLNGFVSELFIYLGLFQTALAELDARTWGATALAVPALALIGALACACFVKVFAAVFLGVGRSNHVNHAREAPAAMTGPMFVLAGCCLAIGLLPWGLADLLDSGVRVWAPELAAVSLRELAPLKLVTFVGLLLLAMIVGGGFWLWACLRRNPWAEGETWGCGYAAPTPRIQYSSSSFAETIVGLFSWVLRPNVHRPGPLQLFPAQEQFHSEVRDTALERAILPVFRAVGWLFSWVRIMQQGGIHSYLLYIFGILILLLLWN